MNIQTVSVDIGAEPPWKRRALTGLAFACILLAVMYVPQGALAATGPSIRLFPTTVLEDIRQTSQVAAAMESGLQDIIARLDQQLQLYRESRCEGNEEDPGCAQLARQLGATYLEMLNAMGEQLPDMEQAVNSTQISLEKRLRKELGQKMTPWGLQELLLGNGKGKDSSAPRPSLRGRSGMRLSDRFRQYYQLVAQSGGSNGHSLAVIASDIYLDMQETADLIARTQEEISRAALLEQLNQSFGIITPEMQQVVAGVKSILFGDPEAAAPVAGPPPGSAEQSYRSPLAM